MHAIGRLLIALTLVTSTANAAVLPAVVHKPSVAVYAQPSFDAPTVATLQRDAQVQIAAQQGLWYQLALPADASGYVRVNEVRVAYAGSEGGAANVRVLMGGKAGQGRVTETAGVRGIDESDLKSAAYDQAQLNAMIAYRVDASAAATYAAEQGWQATDVPYASEAKRAKAPKGIDSDTASAAASLAKSVGGLLGNLSSATSAKIDRAAKTAPSSENALAAQELALGPQITGRILGARPLWDDAASQQRVNRVGRWVASQTSRPDLPWTFGIIDTPEVNAFAAPGGFVLMTRGLYELLATDSELAAALAHEIAHCVQRDHYNVIRQQELASTGKDLALQEVSDGSDSAATVAAKRYVEKNGAAIMLTSLDREAEYRSDEAAEIYLARAGMNPLALYSVLQKMTALGNDSASLAELYKSHPPLDSRVDRIDQRGYAGLQVYTTRE
jgi:hypothetical protein